MQQNQFVALALLVGGALSACQQGSWLPANPFTWKKTHPAANDPVHPLTITAIRDDDFKRRIKSLSDDYFQGRGPGTPAGERAADWIAREMLRIGLQPGNNGSYFQSVPAITVTLDPARSHLEIDGPKTAAALKPAFADDVVYWTRHAASADEQVIDSPLIFMGYGITAPEENWDDYAGVDVKGKTLVVFINDPGFITHDDSLFKGRAMTYYGRWTYKYEEAARRGAAAVLIVHETEPAAYGWQVVRNSNTGPKSYLDEPTHGMDRVALEAWITTDVAKTLFANAGLDYEKLRIAANQRGFKPVPMTGLTLNAVMHSEITHMTTRNVIGTLRGKTSPDEHFLYTAHWDHLGVKPNLPGADKIYNGAVDNASGVSGILEIAEKFAKSDAPPKRSVTFISWTMEEQGLLGSEYFADHPTIPLEKIAGGVNIDSLIPMGKARDMAIVGGGANELEDVLKTALKAQGRVLAADPQPEMGYFYRSDQLNLARKGVPMLYLGDGGGVDLVKGGRDAGIAARDDYRTHRYHQPSDEYDPNWDVTDPIEDLKALYEAGDVVANGSAWPNWYPGNEFRATRDKSMAVQ